ncbi:MAG TPA: signal peptidase I [Candidatus Binataceae bacterium]|nr:signal peptidase I [Candidatus Binataceae bacterium]
MSEPARKWPAPPVTESRKSALREYGEAFAVALALAIVLRTFLIQAYKIPSGSMERTLLIGDHIIVNKLVFGLRMPDSIFGLTPFAGEIPYGKYLFQLERVHRGDVVVFVYPEDQTKDFIKRVVAIPGDVVEIKNGMLILNGVQVDAPYTHFEVGPNERSTSPRDTLEAVRIQPGQYFMMGDNRDRSYDSRFWGPVSRDAIEGRAMFIYWSCADDSSPLTCFYDVRWSRLFHPIR